MRNSVLAAICGVFLCAGCQLLKPLRNPDSLDNATSQTWSITAEFTSGLRNKYEQAPESLSNFGTMSRGTMPVLTNLVAVSRSTPPVRHALSAREMGQLRGAAAGGLTLVLYDEGIACLSPAIKKALEQGLLKTACTQEEYFRQLRAQAPAALQWTSTVIR